MSQKTKNPGAEKNNEQIKTSMMFPKSLKYTTLLRVIKMPQSNPLMKDANIQIVKVRPVNFKYGLISYSLIQVFLFYDSRSIG
jgi:hypothetical protein